MNPQLILTFLKSTKGKVIIISIVAVIITIIVYLNFSKIKDKIIDKQQNKQLAQEMEAEITSEALSYPQTQYNAYASTLYKAMKGAGTDENAIYSVFRNMLTRSDVLNLIRTYGVKDSENLNEWLLSELSTSEIDKINKILAGNDVNYKF